RLPRPARAGGAHAQGAGVGAHRAGAAPGDRARGARRAVAGRRGARARCQRGRDPRQAALDPRAGAGGWGDGAAGNGHVGRNPVMRASVAGWVFVAPALLVLGLFFALPVVSALLLSLTDFDLYALADRDHLRFVALGNYMDLLRTPLFWKSLWNTTYFVVLGVPLSIAVSLAAA